MRMCTAFFIGLSSVIGLAGLVAWAPPAMPLRASAEAFVASLSEGERAKCLRPLDATERTNWYFARGERAGLFLRDMDSETRAATLALVDGFLSAAGREQWRLIRVVEAINLRRAKRPGVGVRDRGPPLCAARGGD